MRRRVEMPEDPVDEVVHRRFVRVVGLPEVTSEVTSEVPSDVIPATTPDFSRELSPAVSHDEVAGGDQAGAAQALRAFDPGRRGVQALAAVAVVVVAVAGFLAWRSRPQVAPLAVRVEATASVPGSGTSTGALIVAVAGRVQRPGLVRLPAGSRVADAIEAAGGPLPATDLSYVNLARKVADGELLLIGVPPPPGAGGTGGGSASGGGSDGAGGQVNLNTATLTDLQTLPGVGPVLAQRIVDHRTKQGHFRSVDELRQVDGIGDTRFKQLKGLVTV